MGGWTGLVDSSRNNQCLSYADSTPPTPKKGLPLLCLESAQIFASVCTFNCTPIACPQPLISLSLSLTHTHTHTAPRSSFLNDPPLSPPLAASLFCRFSPFSLSVHSSKENFIHFILISQMNPEGRKKRWQCEKEGKIGKPLYFSDGSVLLGRTL